jgi:hypothetical protein
MRPTCPFLPACSSYLTLKPYTCQLSFSTLTPRAQPFLTPIIRPPLHYALSLGRLALHLFFIIPALFNPFISEFWWVNSHPSSVILQRTVLVAVTMWEDHCVEEQCWYWLLVAVVAWRWRVLGVAQIAVVFFAVSIRHLRWQLSAGCRSFTYGILL